MLGDAAAHGGGGDGTAAAPRPAPSRSSAVGVVGPADGGDGRSTTTRCRRRPTANQATYWPTENYRNPPSLGKPGVGLVLDAGRTVSPRRITVTTDTPGYRGADPGGRRRDGPFHDVSGSQTVGARTTFDLHGADARYFVVWITSLGSRGSAHVNEVTAS